MRHHGASGDTRGRGNIADGDPRNDSLKYAELGSVTAVQFLHRFALPRTHASRLLDNRIYDTALGTPPATSLAQNVDGTWGMQTPLSHNAPASYTSSPTPSKIE
jgi:hypothetical protein